MKKMKKILFIFFVAFCSCNNKTTDFPEDVEKVLISSKNRQELENALNFYSAKGNDSLKRDAMFFLVRNMLNRYSIVPSQGNDPYVEFIRRSSVSEKIPWDSHKSVVGHKFDSIASNSDETKVMIIRDIDVITKDFLVYNVEHAFDSWYRSKTITKCSYEDFKEYILPYRLGTEPLSYWRQKAFSKFSLKWDSVKNPIEMAKLIVKDSGVRYNAGMSKYPYSPSFEDLEKFKWGSCDHICLYLTLSLRALGIPASIDIVPNWANRSSGHVWNVIRDTTGKFVDFGFTNNGANNILYKIPKIYRTTFSVNSNSLNLNWRDVTSQYNMPLSDIHLPIFGNSFKRDFVYLSVFNNHRWVPVAQLDSIVNDKYLFKNIGRGMPYGNNKIAGYENEGKGVVYLPTVVKGNKVVGFSYPVLLKENGEYQILFPNQSLKDTVSLYRKYPKYGHISVYASRMLGGVFETSNNIDFTNPTLIHKITSSPIYALTEFKLKNTVACRYLRYKAPDKSWVNVSEFEVFYKNQQLRGKLLASDPQKQGDELIRFSDNNIDTYYSGEEKDAYIGFDFGKEVFIDKIVYSPRTDGNDIVQGEEYELFYWDKKWVSLGKQRANNFYLQYYNVPKNSLLLLHNHTKGIEERIFTYENNKQIWW